MKALLLSAAALVLMIIISGCTSSPNPVEQAPPEMIEFAACLSDSDMHMYGSYVCAICAKQRNLFQGAFEQVGEIECHPRGENPQTDLCLSKDIEKTPTWIFEPNGEEQERLVGFQTLETLADISGCSLPDGT